jgi:hypothetical protein
MPIVAAIGLAVVTGVTLGPLTEWVERLVYSPTWYEVWHGVVPWAAITLAVGFAVRAPGRLAAMAGLITQLALVGSYYRTLYGNFGAEAREHLAIFGLVALLMGPLYGLAGAWLREPASRHRALVVAPLSGAWLVDATTILWEIADPDYTESQHVVDMTTAGVTYAVVGTGLLVWLSRSRGVAARAAFVCLAAVAARFAFLEAYGT